MAAPWGWSASGEKLVKKLVKREKLRTHCGHAGMETDDEELRCDRRTRTSRRRGQGVLNIEFKWTALQGKGAATRGDEGKAVEGNTGDSETGKTSHS